MAAALGLLSLGQLFSILNILCISYEAGRDWSVVFFDDDNYNDDFGLKIHTFCQTSIPLSSHWTE